MSNKISSSFMETIFKPGNEFLIRVMPASLRASVERQLIEDHNLQIRKHFNEDAKCRNAEISVNSVSTKHTKI